jgi:hypothetical protein
MAALHMLPDQLQMLCSRTWLRSVGLRRTLLRLDGMEGVADKFGQLGKPCRLGREATCGSRYNRRGRG